VDGHRTKPDEKDLSWKQISILGILEDKQLPLFIEWLSLDHHQWMEKQLQRLLRLNGFPSLQMMEN
jgi:hypothetical protein